MLEVRDPDTVSNVFGQTCPIFSQEFVRWERMPESMKVGLGVQRRRKASGDARATGRPRDREKDRDKIHMNPERQATTRRDFCTIEANEIVCTRDRGTNGFKAHGRGREHVIFAYFVQPGVCSNVERSVCSNVPPDTKCLRSLGEDFSCKCGVINF